MAPTWQERLAALNIRFGPWGPSGGAYPKTWAGGIEDWVLIGDKWHHLVYTFPKDGLPLLYIDGQPAQGRAYTAVYNRALSEAEIAEHYRVGEAALRLRQQVDT